MLRSFWLVLLGGVLAPTILVSTGWWVTDHLEGDDRFCIACHLEPTVPLHRAKFEDFRGRKPVSLAAAHAAAARKEGQHPFHCIDCHGGTGVLGRARVKLLSARDAFWYATGHFEEPEEMRWPLRDADCRQCHERFEKEHEGETSSWRDPDFHALAVHNTKLSVSCVECHLSHERGGLRGRFFLHPAAVREQCARCHSEFDELADSREGS